MHDMKKGMIELLIGPSDSVLIHCVAMTLNDGRKLYVVSKMELVVIMVKTSYLLPDECVLFFVFDFDRMSSTSSFITKGSQ